MRDWRLRVRRLWRLWRTSLQFRTVAITIVLSGIAVVVIGGYMQYSIGTNLFSERVTQSLDLAARATVSTQNRFAAADASTESDPPLENTMRSAFSALATSSSTAAVVIARTPGQGSSAGAPLGRVSGDFDESLISPQLRADVGGQGDERRTYWQSIALPMPGGAVHPGLVVGSVVDLSTAGQYELYLVFDLVDTQATLDLVRQTLLVGFSALVLLIGAVAWLVSRLVVGPVRTAAQTSERLAAGELDIRIPVHGDDDVATLARSFNRMAASMQQQITRLATLSQVQQRFVSDVSHELRTPLTTIRLAGDVLHEKRDEFDPTSARTVELLHDQVQRFESLLADLLEMSRYDAGAVEMDAEPTNLVRLADDAIASLATLAATKGSEVRLVAPGGYFEADVDPRRIRRILLNLLGNAIDHGEGRPVVVYVDSDSAAVAIAVRDYGVGMTAGQVERVFDRFWRADPSRQRTTGGTGLGLAIALEDAGLHGGRLDVWSEPGAGSCFRLTIPRVRGGEFALSPLALPPAEAVPHREDA
ncbi:MtrAB system histidine kinase MtrB [Galbitalea sp. SE-J8]|uniref:MtrAB system histidine kinase MtrB n=1 Tax=Galbitalea sp. SE-J8 TaxID=3054952 RepID=UPI00259C95FE|nr:MtrAB system histidine kinase MtrB [Galbitalea sp. SE-J8]MDM4762704.1 MtrAB system histidine kinase MtrB [Galbitalea sp. SE-J8]